MFSGAGDSIHLVGFLALGGFVHMTNWEGVAPTPAQTVRYNQIYLFQPMLHLLSHKQHRPSSVATQQRPCSRRLRSIFQAVTRFSKISICLLLISSRTRPSGKIWRTWLSWRTRTSQCNYQTICWPQEKSGLTKKDFGQTTTRSSRSYLRQKMKISRRITNRSWTRVCSSVIARAQM